MSKLTDFIKLMTGHFDNKEQFDKMQAEGKHIHMQNTSIQHVTIKSKISQKTSMVYLL